MASELRVTTIANNAGTESVNTTYVINGSAKAWLNIDTTSFTIRDNLNNSSATDVGSGLATFNVTSAMNNDDFAFAISRNGNTGTSNNLVIEQTAQTTSSISVSTKFMYTGSINLGDATTACATLFGDLA